MSKQWGLGLGAHILSAVPAGPAEEQHTDECKHRETSGKDDGLLKPWWIIIEIKSNFVSVDEINLRNGCQLLFIYSYVKCQCRSSIWPLYQNWVSARAVLPEADWSGGTGRWCWEISPGPGGSGSSAHGRPPDEPGRSASTEATPRHSATTWQPSDGPCRTLSRVYEMIRQRRSAREEVFSWMRDPNTWI